MVINSLSGQFNLFATLGAGPPPGPPGSNPDYTSLGLAWQDTVSIIIQGTDDIFGTKCANPVSCPLVIGVVSVRPGNFTINVRAPTDDLILLPGVPSVSALSFGSFVTQSITFELPFPTGSAETSVTFEITGLDVPLTILLGSTNYPDPSLFFPGECGGKGTIAPWMVARAGELAGVWRVCPIHRRHLAGEVAGLGCAICMPLPRMCVVAPIVVMQKMSY